MEENKLEITISINEGGVMEIASNQNLTPIVAVGILEIAKKLVMEGEANLKKEETEEVEETTEGE